MNTTSYDKAILARDIILPKPVHRMARQAVKAAKTAWLAVCSAVRRHGAALRQRRKARSALRILNTLDARVLQDLGIDRSELPSLALDPDDISRARAFWRVQRPANGPVTAGGLGFGRATGAIDNAGIAQ